MIGIEFSKVRWVMRYFKLTYVGQFIETKLRDGKKCVNRRFNMTSYKCTTSVIFHLPCKGTLIFAQDTDEMNN